MCFHVSSCLGCSSDFEVLFKALPQIDVWSDKMYVQRSTFMHLHRIRLYFMKLFLQYVILPWFLSQRMEVLRNFTISVDMACQLSIWIFMNYFTRWILSFAVESRQKLPIKSGAMKNIPPAKVSCDKNLWWCILIDWLTIDRHQTHGKINISTFHVLKLDQIGYWKWEQYYQNIVKFDGISFIFWNQWFNMYFSIIFVCFSF